MAKPFGRPVHMTALPISKLPMEEIVIAESTINKGMNTTIDAADIDNGALTVAKNARIRFDKTSRRSGKATYGATKPDSLFLKKLQAIKLDANRRVYLRLTPTSVYYFDGDSTWTQMTGAVLESVETDFMQVGLALDTFFFTNFGRNRIQKLNFETNTYADLGTIAPYAKTATAFGDRVVGGNIGNDLTAQSTLAWSGNRNFPEFDAAVDETAGNSPLVANPKDLSDAINLIWGFTSVMLIFRDSSIWVAQLSQIDTSPFIFYPTAPGFGAVPETVCIGSGVASGQAFFVDIRKRTAFAWTPGSNPEPIGRPIENSIFESIDDKSLMFSEYLSATDEYCIGIKNASTETRKIWIFNARTKAWSYDEIDNVTCLAELSGQLEYTSIDELTGTINALTGTINALTTITELPPVIAYGYKDGSLTQEDDTKDDDNSIAYTTEIRSKEFKIPRNDMIITQLRFEYVCIKAGSFIIQYSKNGGVSWTTAKTIPMTVSDSKKLATFKKALKARRLMWRITAITGIFDTVNYEVIANASGESIQST